MIRKSVKRFSEKIMLNQASAQTPGRDAIAGVSPLMHIPCFYFPRQRITLNPLWTPFS
jgi:hypothetical protein